MKIDISNKDSVHKIDIAALYGSKHTGKSASDETTSDTNVALAEDELEISQEASQKANDMHSQLEEMRSRYRTLSEELEKAREVGEGVAEAWKEKIRCLQIAMRIISGNKVPEADVKYLQDKDPELYAKSITMRVEKADPKEHNRLSEDEEDKVEEETGREPVGAEASGDTDVGADTGVPTDTSGEAFSENPEK